MKASLIFILAILVLFSGCKKSEEHNIPPQVLIYDFENGLDGWIGGMSDFPSDWDPAIFEFYFDHEPLPTETGQEGNALVISGHNRSDDLFMFFKREITGLKPNKTYSLHFDVELASQDPTESFGIGGSPGSSVYLKAGGATIEPAVVDVDGMYVMNIDKGDQSQGGQNMAVLGTIGIPGEEFKYTLIQKSSEGKAINVTSDSNGRIWVIIGTDSGFEGITTLYYNSVTISLQEL